MTIGARELAKLLAEELERDQWGDIDPYLFRMIADGHAPTSGHDDVQGAALARVLERVAARLAGRG